MSSPTKASPAAPGGVVPEMGTIATASATFGVSRSWLYRAAPSTPGLLRKLGRRTLVDIALLRAMLAGLPHAEVRGGEIMRGSSK